LLPKSAKDQTCHSIAKASAEQIIKPIVVRQKNQDRLLNLVQHKSLLESTCLPAGRETRLDSNYLKNRDILK